MMLYSVDRFEGDLAVLVDEDGNSRDVPRHRLPAGAKEGAMVRLEAGGSFTPDEEAAARRRARVLALQNRLRRQEKS